MFAVSWPDSFNSQFPSCQTCVQDVVTCGELDSYEKSYDRVTVKSETTLEKTKRAFRNVTTSDDPIIR